LSAPGWLVRYAFVVGSLDALTGILLVASPASVLRLLLITRAPLEPVWLRFIGGFVAGVGLLYLYPLIARPERRAPLLAASIELTALVRGAVGLVVAGCVAAGALGPGWTTVALTDLSLATWQAVVVRRSRAVARRSG
jgi:hypothetical protein